MTTTDLAWLAQLPGRCPRCYMHLVAHGHRSQIDGHPTGCPDEGPVADLLAARRLRDAGMARTVSAHPDDAARVDVVLSRFISSGRPFSANDTRPLLSGVKGAVVGSRFNAAARAGRIKRTGNRIASTDPGTHAHRLDEWIGVAA